MILITYKLLKFSQLFFIYFYYYTFRLKKKKFEKILFKNNSYSDNILKKKFFFSNSFALKFPTKRTTSDLGSFRKIAKGKKGKARKKRYPMKVGTVIIKQYNPSKKIGHKRPKSKLTLTPNFYKSKSLKKFGILNLRKQKKYLNFFRHNKKMFSFVKPQKKKLRGQFKLNNFKIQKANNKNKKKLVKLHSNILKKKNFFFSSKVKRILKVVKKFFKIRRKKPKSWLKKRG